MTLCKAIICDLDNTLSDCRHRLHFVDPNARWEPLHYNKSTGKREFKKDYDAFYAAMDKDGANEWCKLICSLYLEHIGGLLLVTGRPERYRDTTFKWLDKNNIFPTKLFMRPDFITDPDALERQREAYKANGGNICLGQLRMIADHRPAHEVKKEIYQREIKDKYDILFVLEDDDDCVTMYQDLGLQVLKVLPVN